MYHRELEVQPPEPIPPVIRTPTAVVTMETTGNLIAKPFQNLEIEQLNGSNNALHFLRKLSVIFRARIPVAFCLNTSFNRYKKALKFRCCPSRNKLTLAPVKVKRIDL